ncbi:L-threonine dehydratase catabolic TdcB-like [Danaus plexippus]|uniref:L-threonine dehydratase catabolic TdcB-like n=1 Tax=Danaus plexippus TaxID=13037 RepID=UPI002AAFE496|nr:L-threonine dehydratase catabolic TdcB-like [Danaus plexippus]
MACEKTYESCNYFGDISGAYKQNDFDQEPSDSISKIRLKLEDIQEAHNRIKSHITVTPIVESKYVGNHFCNVLLKCENLQLTGSFKARGTFNVVSCMTTAEKGKGCTVAGGRNFLNAMTYSGFKESVPVNVVVPKDCSLADKQKYKENYAVIKVFGNDSNESSLHALTYCDEIGSHFIRCSDRLDLLAGYGTLGLEILSQVDKLDAIICPVGTGGLIASILVAVKSLKPQCLIYGVESSAAPTMSKALQEKKPTIILVKPTIAESIADKIASNNAFHIIKRYLTKMITVDDLWISRAMVNLLEREKIIVEAAAATPVAAIMAGKVPELRGKNVVCVLTGGNINYLVCLTSWIAV